MIGYTPRIIAREFADFIATCRALDRCWLYDASIDIPRAISACSDFLAKRGVTLLDHLKRQSREFARLPCNFHCPCRAFKMKLNLMYARNIIQLDLTFDVKRLAHKS